MPALLSEDFFATLKQYRGITTRDDKKAKTLLGAIYFAASVLWLSLPHALAVNAAYV
jgi:transposase